MSDNSHQESQFVVCQACKRYFFLDDIVDHQKKEHADHEWEPKDDPYRRFYYLTNSEVAYSMNRAKEVKDAINAVRLLVL